MNETSSREKIEHLISLLATEQGMSLPLTDEQHVALWGQVMKMIDDYCWLSATIKALNDKESFMDDLTYRY